MRLIDADKLIEICRKGWKLFGRENEKIKHWVDEYDIRSQPTVDAIPVEWIKRYAKKGGRIANILFPFEIEMMLEDWENKEWLQ